MRVLYSWLCDYLDEKLDFKTVTSNLSRIGFSIDDVKIIGADVDDVYVAEVLSVKKHPNADRLSLCEVSDGKKIYNVVCGAPNVRAEQKVPFAVVGARLGNEVLKKAKIRGVESEGMICSESELGLADKSDGIMVLDDKLELGKSIKELFPPDYSFELEITPNLGYCLSHYSLARELSIFYGYKLKEFKPSKLSTPTGRFDIEIKTDDCLRYQGIVIKNIKNKTTPTYIYDRLKKIGLNPKNNMLIDVSNYLMFELGQPTHFFDLRNISEKIVVRKAFKDEKIKTLDGKDNALDENIMVIADSKKPLAVAGVMGGYFSSINDDTSDILVEIAHFVPAAVRRSSKILGIKTDSSYRYERGVDVKLSELAASRICEIIKTTNQDSEIYSITDVKNYEEKEDIIDIDHSRINRILGTAISDEKMDEVLRRLDGLYDGHSFHIPSYRADIKSIWDISEEVARYIGYDVIESKTSMPVLKSKDDPFYELKKNISSKFSVFGFNECVNYDLVCEDEIKKLGYDINGVLKLSNPLSKEFEYLRPSILPSLLKNLRYNSNRGIKSTKIYEYGSVFGIAEKKPVEKRILSAILSGSIDETIWWKKQTEEIDFFYTKSVVEYLLSNFSGIRYTQGCKEKFMVSDMSADIWLGDKKIGFYGLLNPDISDMFDLKSEKIFYFEVLLEEFVKKYSLDFASLVKKPKKVSDLQYGIRDLSILVDKKYRYEDIYRVVSKAEDLIEVTLIDFYDGKNIPEDKKSFTFRFVFSSESKTFTDEELNIKIEEILKKLENSFGARLR